MKNILLLLMLTCPFWVVGSVRTALAQVEEMTEVEEEGEAEEERELETDRDSFTPATTTAGAWRTIFESSYSFIDNRGVAETHSFPEILIRFGVTERIELRLGWNFEVGGSGDLVSGNAAGEELEGNGIERESQLLYGFKAAVSEQAAWLPRSALIVQAYTPTSGEAPETDILVTYVIGWELPNLWRLDASLHYATEHGPEDALNLWAPSVVLRVPLSERWHTHIEYFGIYSQGAEREFSRAFISPGVHCLITPEIELGVRVGWALTDDAPNFFSNVGVGVRF